MEPCRWKIGVRSETCCPATGKKYCLMRCKYQEAVNREEKQSDVRWVVLLETGHAASLPNFQTKLEVGLCGAVAEPWVVQCPCACPRGCRNRSSGLPGVHRVVSKEGRRTGEAACLLNPVNAKQSRPGLAVPDGPSPDSAFSLSTMK